MHGNVWQWSDNEERSGRVIRGGRWDHEGRSCRALNRGWASPTVGSGHVGFRVARVPSGE
jgi:formylglycine-generating enzyme required for sulfatase activity